ncbi:MAG: DUF402 domain-containing protein [Microbacterium sp.]
MHVVEDRDDVVVAWLPDDTEISYWATEDGEDPRTMPLEERFHLRLVTRRRHWAGGGVLRVIPVHEQWQVIHFWNQQDGSFAGWYVNLESTKRRDGDRLDAVDWHLDLTISPDFEIAWKDEDEAAAALGTPYMRDEDLAAARAVGEHIAADPRALIDTIGDWRGFTPPSRWHPLALPPAGTPEAQ